MPKTIAIAAGGTGGHVLPARVLAEALRERGHGVVFFGTGRELERKLLEPFGFEIVPVNFGAVLGAGPLGLLKRIVSLPMALSRVMREFRSRKIECVIGFGGYPSVIPILAAALLGLPRYLHEQNVHVGLANRFLSLFVQKIFAVKGAKDFWSGQAVIEVGNPVRAEFLKVADWKAPQAGEFKVLFVGGSQGAKSLNQAAIDLAPFFALKRIQPTVISGPGDRERVEQAFKTNSVAESSVQAFSNEIWNEYAKAHLVICRAGAMTAAEVAATGRPAIFIPLSIAQGHQRENVREHQRESRALVIDSENDLAEQLKEILNRFLMFPAELEGMAKNAATARSAQQNAVPQILEQLSL